ncbi:hypothetical protein GCM10027060_22570 [Nesterenkonia halophila]|uniref:hypothetical protein n=1 Tax=Nesterenkonia halophila TaxID=302044 RepID=UPI0012925ADD|nr:hypothetical protein [Nesterenkonia halophila]
MSSPSRPPGSAPDPWAGGSTAYRATLVAGMLLLAAGVVAAILTASGAADAVAPAAVLLGLGILLHLISIGVRMRDVRVALAAERTSSSTQNAKDTDT